MSTVAAPAGSTVTVRRDSPLCGDVIDLTVSVADDRVREATYQARACSLAVASARALAELLPQRSVSEARDLAARLELAVRGKAPLPEGFEAIAPVRLLPSRRGCALLPWRALVDALGRVT